MRIGEFVKTVGTTVDTVRHYEELGFIHPERVSQQKHYLEEHVQAFEAVQELKSVGFSLEDIRLIFRLRESYGCGSPKLVEEVIQQFESHIEALDAQIVALEDRRHRLSGLLRDLAAVTNQ